MDITGRLQHILPKERLLTDPVPLLTYDCDGYGLERNTPMAVAFPHSTDEVLACVQACLETKTPYVARGAGTGLSGGATPGEQPGILLALAGMKQCLSIDAVARSAVVQPGLVNQTLSNAAARHGLYFAPDPSSQAACTLGGNVAENSGGPHCFKYGMTTDHVLGASFVSGRGEVIRLRRDDGPDLLSLLTGSEGTFGVLTELELKLSPKPQCVKTWLVAFASMNQACDAVSEIVASGLVPAALEVLDHLAIKAVEASSYASGYPTDAHAVLLVEVDGSQARVRSEEELIEQILSSYAPLQLESTEDPKQRLRLWKGRKGAFGAMGRLAPDLLVMDGVVPRSKLRRVLERIVEIGKDFEITLSNVFHAGDGNLHPNISFDARDPVARAKVLEAGMQILALCVAEGGSITGEHGVGLEKLKAMHLMFSAPDLEVFAEIKEVFDPERLCNPGKILPTGGACSEASSSRNPEVLDAG